jgi:hypothetical protein
MCRSPGQRCLQHQKLCPTTAGAGGISHILDLHGVLLTRAHAKGKTVSSSSTSLASLEVMRPFGVLSWNATGDLNTPSSAFTKIDLEAFKLVERMI